MHTHRLQKPEAASRLSATPLPCARSSTLISRSSRRCGRPGAALTTSSRHRSTSCCASQAARPPTSGRELRRLGTWWANAPQWVVIDDQDDEFEIRPSPDVVPGLLFVRVAEPKVQKNRLHIDLRPDDQEHEVARLTSLGARLVDVGQGNSAWVVLADPEGNEFCVLRQRSS